jgi:citrate lyase beta subunit
VRTTLESVLPSLLARAPKEPQAPAQRVREPAHVLYGGARRFSRDTPAKLGRLARRALEVHAPTPSALAAILGPATDEALLGRVHARLTSKLEREPIEDLRIDFEDGFGPASDGEEDAEAVRAAEELVAAGALPPFVGLRVRALRGATAGRALRTLDLFLTAAAEAVPRLGSLVVTLPKVEGPGEVALADEALGVLERLLGLPEGHVGIEPMVESPGPLLGAGLTRLVEAGGGRVRSVHLGTYDLLSALDVTAAAQRSDHPAAQAARVAMKLQLAGTGVAVCDGATHLLPLGDDAIVVSRAFRVHAEGVRRALELGVYRGWDLHPTQLLSRWAATFAFFLTDLGAQSERLSAFLARARAAERTGATFDDAASAQGLLHTFQRGRACGALDDDDLARAGLLRGDDDGAGRRG